MIVDAQVWHWTPNGMRPGSGTTVPAYIEVRDVERFLEEAHERGRRAGILAEQWAKVLL